MQHVYLGKNRFGQHGYFTNGYLAWALTSDQAANPESWHINYTSKLNFKFLHSGV